MEFPLPTELVQMDHGVDADGRGYVAYTVVTPAPQQAAQAGAELLDRTMPGWHDRVDLTRLEVGDSDCCPLGQLGGFEQKLQELFPEKSSVDVLHEAWAAGFVGIEYPALNVAWRDQIIDRRFQTARLRRTLDKVREEVAA